MQRKSKKQPLTLSYDKIIVGSSLEAVLFAHQTNTTLISTRLEKPYYFELIEDFGLGSNKLEIWDKHIFLLSLGGFVPFNDSLKHIRYIDANTIKVVTATDCIVTIKFNNLFLFDDHKFYDLPPEIGITTKENMIIDWLKVLSGKHHQLDYIDRDNNFINRLLFHKSGRPRKDKHKKDCIAISYLTDSQLQNSNYAEYVVRIRTEKIMQEHGIKSTNDYPISIEHLRRDIIPLGRSVYDYFDNVIPMVCDPKNAWEFGNPRSKITYLRYLKTKLGL